MTNKTPAQELREISVEMSTLASLLESPKLHQRARALYELADRIERDRRAFVLPDPKAQSQDHGREWPPVDQYIEGREHGWNACIDEFKRLNGVKS